MRYTCHFYGRQKNAIGVFHPCRFVVTADDAEAATLALYDTHDHVMHLQITELHPDAPDAPSGCCPRPGVEYGCGEADCRDCYEAEVK